MWKTEQKMFQIAVASAIAGALGGVELLSSGNSIKTADRAEICPVLISKIYNYERINYV